MQPRRLVAWSLALHEAAVPQPLHGVEIDPVEGNHRELIPNGLEPSRVAG